MDWFFENDGARTLGAAVGLDAETSRHVLAQGLPRQLQALADYSRAKVGSEQITEAVRIIPRFPSVLEALSMGQGAADLERAGESLAPTLLREHRTQIPDVVTAQTGADRGAVGKLLDMTLPLILSRLSWRDDVALRFLPLVGGSLVTPGAAVAIPTNAAVAPVTRQVAQTVTGETSRRGAFPLWIVPLALLLLLGGCLMLRPKNVTPAPGAAEAARTSPVTSQFTVITPAKGTEVSANGFTAEGTGPAEQVYTMYRAGDKVGEFTVGKDNRWRVEVLDGAAPAGDVMYTFRDARGNIADTLNLRAKGPDSVAAALAPMTVNDPLSASEVAAGGFNITGTGQPNTTYTAFEDGANIGSFTVAPDGTWSVDVPGPSAGAHTYTILDAQGNRVALLPVTVAAGASSGTCTDALSVSLGDNETVSAPFRFGGRGGGSGYTVSVWRGDRQVGTRDVKLTGDCTWSYASNPGGRDGVKSVVRYEVRPVGTGVSAPAAAKVTLNVSGSGTNFNSKGEYVGPTR